MHCTRMLPLLLLCAICGMAGCTMSAEDKEEEDVMKRRVVYSRVVALISLERGYYDRLTGERIVDPEIELVPLGRSNGLAPFKDGLAMAWWSDGKKGFKLGYVDMMGHFVIPPIYLDAEDFHEGRAVVITEEGKGMINTLGELVIAPGTMDWLGPCQEGRIPFRKDGMWGYVSRDGEVVIPPQFKEALGFSEGLGLVWDEKEGNVYVASQGERRLVLPREAYAASSFKEGLAAVLVLDDVENPFDREGLIAGKWGYIDRRGQRVIPARFVDAKDFSEGLAAVSITAGNLKNGLALEKEQKRRWGFIDHKGRTVIPFDYDEVRSFQEGLAPFRSQDKWGCIDRQGKIVIPATYPNPPFFTDGLAIVIVERKLWCIDHTGAVIIKSDILYVEY